MSNILNQKFNLSPATSKRKSDVPFYEAPTGITTSSQIIKETKETVQQQQQQQNGKIRSLQTNRPFTPKEETRTLFGSKSVRPVSERPTSSISINAKTFETIDAGRPLSNTRLTPINDSKPQIKLSTQSSVEPVVVSPLVRQSSKTRLLPQLQYPSRDEILEYERKASGGSQRGIDVVEDTEEDRYWKTALKPHLDQMANFYCDKKEEQLMTFCDEFYVLLDARSQLGKNSTKRSTILKAIFKLLDTECDNLKLKLARIILALEVSSNNLTNICRLLFSLSRKETNDVYFIENDLLTLILHSSERLDFKSNSDSIVYFCAALKNLSGNSKILKEISQKNVVSILANILKSLSQFYKDTDTKKAEAGHALVQLTATLRNLADLPLNREKIIQCKIIEELSNALKYYTSDSDLTLNISRIYSKLTLHSDCCQILSACVSCYKSFIKIMIKHDSNQDLIVRICFIIGNMASRNDDARVCYANEKYSFDTLINLLKFYLSQVEKSERLVDEESNDEQCINPHEDALVKIIRVFANLSINEKVGYDISSREDFLDLILKILDSKFIQSEELIINTIGTLNNLSFYETPLFDKRCIDIVNSLMKYLLSNNQDAILEVFRVFANLTHFKQIQDLLVLRKVDLMAITFLDSDNRELVYNVLGVLMNLMCDEKKRYILKQEDGIMKLIEVLSDFGRTDLQLASVVCKVLMNFSDKLRSCNECFGNQQTYMLINVLSELLDEQLVLNNARTSNLNEDGYVLTVWRDEFCPVAKLLLERINTHKSQYDEI